MDPIHADGQVCPYPKRAGFYGEDGMLVEGTQSVVCGCIPPRVMKSFPPQPAPPTLATPKPTPPPAPTTEPDPPLPLWTKVVLVTLMLVFFGLACRYGGIP